MYAPFVRIIDRLQTNVLLVLEQTYIRQTSAYHNTVPREMTYR
jgi:hypothetical protein